MRAKGTISLLFVSGPNASRDRSSTVTRSLTCFLALAILVAILALLHVGNRAHIFVQKSLARLNLNRELKSTGPILRYHDPWTPRRMDKWDIIGPGGGGTFYDPAISPHDTNLVLVTSDMTDCFISENGGQTWREFNLRMTCHAAFDPKLPNRIYALAGTAGLWRSDDRGHTWSMVYPDPSTVTAYWYVDDEGEPYLLTTRGFPPTMTAFDIDPTDSNVLFAVADQTLMVTKDAGRHWKELATGVAGQKLYIDPTSLKERRTVYAMGGNTVGVWDGSKYKLNAPPQGSTWFYGSAFGLPPGGAKPVIYTANDFVMKGGVVTGGGILATHDGGATWTSVNQGLLDMVAKGTAPEFSAIATSLHHPEEIYAAFYHLNLPHDSRSYYGVAKTSDGGATWTLVRKESDRTASNMHDSWISQRFGPDFGDQPLGMAADAKDSNLVYTTDLGRVMRSSDGGENWHAVYSQGADHGYTSTGLDVTTSYGMHFDPNDRQRMFISYTDIGLFRSEDSGASWVSSTTNGVPRAWMNTTYWVEFDPSVKGKMWSVMSGTHDLPRMRMFRKPGSTAGFHGGVVVSEDGGNSWAISSRGLPDMAATHILLDPNSPPDARILYVTGFGRGVFKSIDGGKSWLAKNTGLPATEPLTWRMAMDRNGALYVVTIRRSEDGTYGSDRDGGLFRSTDGAETWQKMPLPEGLNGPVAITVDPQDPLRLYVSAWGRYKLYAAGVLAPMGGVFLSPDGGQHWENVLTASRRIYDVTVDARDPNVVYATGFECSAWRSTDRGKTWKRILGFNFKHGHRVIPDPQDSSKIYITTFGSSVWHGPAEGDPRAVEDIVSPSVATFATPGGGVRQR